MFFKDVSSFRNFTLDKKFSFIILIADIKLLMSKAKDYNVVRLRSGYILSCLT